MIKLAVVIPALNEQNLITKTLESLNFQTVLDFTLIFVDNGSTDDTVKIVNDYAKKSKYPITVISEKKAGVGYARNTGMQKALEIGAAYIAGTDADTILPSDWISSIYEGFKNSGADLVCGQCDPLKVNNISHEKALFSTNARSVLFKNVKPYVRGANYAITTEMFKKVGSIKQPLTKEGNPAPGEDGLLELDVYRNNGTVSGCLSTVTPHPRRYISNLLNISNFSGRIHEGGIVTQIRDEENLEDTLKNIPSEVIDKFVDKIFINLFFANVVSIYEDPLYKARFWENSLKMLKPFNALEIEEDIEKIKDLNVLWSKYGDTFLNNIKAYL